MRHHRRLTVPASPKWSGPRGLAVLLPAGSLTTGCANSPIGGTAMTAPGETKSLTGRICFRIPGLTPPGRPKFKASAEDQAASAGDGMSDGQSAIRLADRHYASRMTPNGGERDRPALANFL